MAIFEITTKTKTYKVPSSWVDVTWQMLLDLERADFNPQKAFNIPEDLYLTYLHLFTDVFDFLQKDIFVQEHNVNVLDLKFTKYVEFVFALQNYKGVEAGLEIVSVYCDLPKESLLSEAITKKYAIFTEVVRQVEQAEKELAELQVKYAIPTKYQVSGAKEFHLKWGYYQVIDHLAGGDILKHNEIINLPTYEVLGKVKFELEQNWLKYQIQKQYEASIKGNKRTL